MVTTSRFYCLSIFELCIKFSEKCSKLNTNVIYVKKKGKCHILTKYSYYDIFSIVPQIINIADKYLNMIYDYQNCIEKYGSNYQLNKAIANSLLFKIEKGLYSNHESVSDLEYISFVRKDAIITLKTATYIYNLTDEVPLEYDLAIDRDASKTNFERVKVRYFYQPKEILNIGAKDYSYNGIKIKIYDKERLLIEIMRYASKLSFDYYKEVISNYRKLDLDIEKIENYLISFKTSNRIMSKIRLEVM